MSKLSPPAGTSKTKSKNWIWKEQTPPAGSYKNCKQLFTKNAARKPYKNCKQWLFKATITTQNVASEIAMYLCIDEKDEGRESEAQSAVGAKKRARVGEDEEVDGGGRGARSFALTADGASLYRSSSFSSMSHVALWWSLCKIMVFALNLRLWK